MNIELLVLMNGFGMLCLVFLLFFARNNIIFEKKWLRIFEYAAITNMLLIVLDVIEYIVEFNGSFISQKIMICLCYMSNPLIPMILLFLLFNKNKKAILCIYLPAVFNAVVCFAMFTIIIITKNTAMQSTCYLIAKITQGFIGIGLLVTFLIFISLKIESVLKAERKFLLIIFLAIITGYILEAVLGLRFVTWNVSSISLVLFYLFMNTQFLMRDILTGFGNRYVFERDLLQYDTSDELVFAVFDINTLKETNDNKGHSFGDELIRNVAKAISSTLKDGKYYRIGGDEFVYVGKHISEGTLVLLLNELVNKLDNPKSLSYGYAFSEKGIPIMETFNTADNRMYDYKKEIKGHI